LIHIDPTLIQQLKIKSKMVVVPQCDQLQQSSSPEDRITSIKHCAPRISSKMATIDEFALKNIGL
jgi:hypothetical protein